MKKNNFPTDSILDLQRPWDNNDNNVWLASTVSLFRNIEKFKFPGKLETDRQKQIIALIGKELVNNSILKNSKLLQAEDLSPLQKEFLVEHFISQQNFQMAHMGEAFILDNSGELLIVLNMHDHMQLHQMDTKGELENSWSRLMEIETHLGRAITYSFSAKYGFLTSDFNRCGTAMLISLFLQVPGLIHLEKIDSVLDNLAEETISITGIQGNPTEIIGDILVIQNNYTLGVTEENIITSLRSFATKLMVEENSARNKIRQEDSAEIKDKVSRAFGILIHSYQIEAIEALNAISLLKLGIELKWVTGISVKEINRLFFNCRRAHLLHQYGEKLKQEEIPHKRSEYIHNTLKDVQLVI